MQQGAAYITVLFWKTLNGENELFVSIERRENKQKKSEM